MVFSTISILFFALGMCMTLIPEWNAFNQGIIFALLGIVLGIITIIIYNNNNNIQKDGGKGAR